MKTTYFMVMKFAILALLCGMVVVKSENIDAFGKAWIKRNGTYIRDNCRRTEVYKMKQHMCLPTNLTACVDHHLRTNLCKFCAINEGVETGQCEGEGIQNKSKKAESTTLVVQPTTTHTAIEVEAATFHENETTGQTEKSTTQVQRTTESPQVPTKATNNIEETTQVTPDVMEYGSLPWWLIGVIVAFIILLPILVVEVPKLCKSQNEQRESIELGTVQSSRDRESGINLLSDSGNNNVIKDAREERAGETVNLELNDKEKIIKHFADN
uniref:uncharacterized protein LOC104266420 n=1 Tax=Ciona intestinalis TaxID=7719 RepID=UPI0005218F72|nr:uncharacterized protein LOC104266420 [Ciona intestinalis]|eukprot:XP_009860871.1 uncharacterized protein LOC104266420 [Ciona intestinalis]